MSEDTLKKLTKIMFPLLENSDFQNLHRDNKTEEKIYNLVPFPDQ